MILILQGYIIEFLKATAFMFNASFVNILYVGNVCRQKN